MMVPAAVLLLLHAAVSAESPAPPGGGARAHCHAAARASGASLLHRNVAIVSVPSSSHPPASRPGYDTLSELS